MRSVYLSGLSPRFQGLSRSSWAGCLRITHPFASISVQQAGLLSIDLHVLGTPPAFILSQDRTLRPKYMGLEPVRSSQSFADRFRSIHMVLFDRKRNFSGPPLGGLAKNESKSDHFKWFDVCPDATHLVCPSSQYPVLKVHALAVHPVEPGRAARRYIARPEGPRGRESRTPYFVHK